MSSARCNRRVSLGKLRYSGDIRIAGHVPAPWPLARLRYSNPWGRGGLCRGRRAIVSHPYASISRDQIRAIELPSDTECLRQLAGPVSQIDQTLGEPSSFLNRIETRHWLYGSQQHSEALAHLTAHSVCAPVNAIAEVDVEVAGLAKHRGVSLCSAAIGMGGRILGAAVGLNFHNAASASVSDDDELVQQLGGDDARVAGIEGTWKDLHRSTVGHCA